MTTEKTRPGHEPTARSQPIGPEAAQSATEGPRPRTPRPLASRVFAGALVAVLGIHMLFTFTWNASPNAFRQLIGADALYSYMTPLFTQGWAVFAPNPGSSNADLQVRASVPDATGEMVTTEWFSITDADHEAAILGHPAPSRLYLNGYVLADRFHGSFLRMNEQVRELAGNDYLDADWPDALQNDLLAALAVPNDPAVTEYLEYERTVTGLATAIARARWGDDVTAVQVKVVTTPVIPFDQRADLNAKTESTYFMEGWRAALDVPGLDESVIRARYGVEAAR
jgi:hypothetical protein